MITLTTKELYKLYSKIAYGYLIKNYSQDFVKRFTGKIKVKFVSQSKGVVELWCKHTGNDFILEIYPFKKRLIHKGVYNLNKGYDNLKLIEHNLNLIFNNKQKEDKQ